MEFFLDTASIEEIKYYKPLGLVDGVTTNPALLSKEGGDPISQIKKIAEIVSGPISVEVTYTEPREMVKHAVKLTRLAPNVVIKVPSSLAGLTAAQELKKAGIRMNVTLVFHPSQAVPFIQLGVDYVSLFIGRVEEFGLNNSEAIWQLRQAIDEMGSPTKMLSASIRNPNYLLEAVMAGSDVVTVPPTCWQMVYKNPIFQLGEKEFLKSWQTLPADARKEYESMD
jgi:transaldolase